MRATVPFIQSSFSKYNELCFEGKLPPVPIKLSRARTFLGKMTYVGVRSLFGKIVRFENYCLRISTCFDLPENELEDVVIHEMIHYYIALNNIKDTSAHGQVFRNMMDKLNTEFGRHISVRHYGKGLADIPGQGGPRECWICVTQLQDGNWGLTSCIRARVFEMHRNLPRCYRLKSLEWYFSTDAFFSRYPRSRKPRIYRVSRAELDEHLTDAIHMSCDGRTIGPV